MRSADVSYAQKTLVENYQGTDIFRLTDETFAAKINNRWVTRNALSAIKRELNRLEAPVRAMEIGLTSAKEVSVIGQRSMGRYDSPGYLLQGSSQPVRNWYLKQFDADLLKDYQDEMARYRTARADMEKEHEATMKVLEARAKPFNYALAKQEAARIAAAAASPLPEPESTEEGTDVA